MNLRDLFGVGTNLKKKIIQENKKSALLLQLEHGFFQQNGPERGQVLVPK